MQKILVCSLQNIGLKPVREHLMMQRTEIEFNFQISELMIGLGERFFFISLKS